jgi:hypothetical protein
MSKDNWQLVGRSGEFSETECEKCGENFEHIMITVDNIEKKALQCYNRQCKNTLLDEDSDKEFLYYKTFDTYFRPIDIPNPLKRAVWLVDERGYSVDPDLRTSWSTFLGIPFTMFLFTFLGSFFGVWVFIGVTTIVSIFLGFQFKNIMTSIENKNRLLLVSGILYAFILAFVAYIDEFFEDLFWLPGLLFTAIYVSTGFYYIKISKDIRDFSIIYDPYDMKHYEDYKKKLEQSS